MADSTGALEQALLRSKIESLVNQMDSYQRKNILAKLSEKPKVTKMRVHFPKVQYTSRDNIQICTTQKEASDFIASFMIEDLDKKPTSTIKAHLVEAFGTLAETMETDAQKQKTLLRASRFVLMNRNHLINSILTMVAV